jgi:hypothetical protein
VRNGKLIALASFNNATRAQAGKSHWSNDLALLGFEWDSVNHRWGKPELISTDTLSNFPPEKLPNGQWAMVRRDHRDNISLLVGGTESPTQWITHNIMPSRTGDFKPNEPNCWPLPDGRLLAVYRDSGGSKRLFRGVSADNGLTWSEVEKSNYPDADSKFFCLRTSRGYYALISCANPAGRNPLCLATSDDGVTFTRLARLPDNGTPRKSGKVSRLQYPHAMEHDNNLFIVYSRGKKIIEITKVSLDEIDRLRSRNL